MKEGIRARLTYHSYKMEGKRTVYLFLLACCSLVGTFCESKMVPGSPTFITHYPVSSFSYSFKSWPNENFNYFRVSSYQYVKVERENTLSRNFYKYFLEDCKNNKRFCRDTCKRLKIRLQVNRFNNKNHKQSDFVFIIVLPLSAHQLTIKTTYSI